MRKNFSIIYVIATLCCISLMMTLYISALNKRDHLETFETTSTLSLNDQNENVPTTTENVIVLPLDNEIASEAIIKENKDRLAAVILDPRTGVIPQRFDFIRAIRDITRKYDILLIFDEIVGFRSAIGGVQSQCGIIPDLTTYGKIIGGGFPIGAFGGRKELMSMLDPTQGKPRLSQSGTFSGHPVAMAAGLAMLNELTSEVYDKLDYLTDRLVSGLTDVFKSTKTDVTVVASGSTFSIYFTAGPVRTYRDTTSADRQTGAGIFLALLNKGFNLSNGLVMNSLSISMDETHIDGLVGAMNEVLENS